MLNNALNKIANKIQNEQTKPYKGNKLACYIRNALPKKMLRVARQDYPHLIARGSAGNGRWAHICGAAIFDPLVTSKPSSGYMISYMFIPDQQRIVLSMMMGIYKLQQKYKRAKAIKLIKQASELVRIKIQDILHEIEENQIIGLTAKKLDLEATKGSLSEGYEAGCVFHKDYYFDAIPEEEELCTDLLHFTRAMETLTYRGGLSLSNEEHGQDGTSKSVDEYRKMKLHMRRETNSKISKLVKKEKGYRCEACKRTMQEIYGNIGNEYIEAHHKTPVSTITAGQTVTLDPVKDFFVLCPNCHRMIHKLDDTSDIELLRTHMVGAEQKGN